MKNTPESNGRVGMIGSSYDGFTTVMGLINPHPALKAAVPQSAMIDGWMGDDWFHYGAFRQTNFDYFTGQMSARGEGMPVPRDTFDDYTNFLRAGSAGDYGKAAGLDQIPYYRKVTEHPSYDDFWSQQALDRTLAAQPLKVPTMWVGALWDQEDMWGTIHAYMATEGKDAGNDMNYLVLGPWRHSGVNYEQRQLNAVKLPGDTATEFRLKVLKPFLDAHLKTGAPKGRHASCFHLRDRDHGMAQAAQVAAGLRDRLPRQDEGPLSRAGPGPGLRRAPGDGPGLRRIRLRSGKARALRPPAGPSRRRRPVAVLADHRPAPCGRPARRPDLPHRTADLTNADLPARPSSTCSPRPAEPTATGVVKLIDVYPDTVPSQVELGGYELPVAMDIFRGRYRESFETPKPIPAGQVQKYRFVLPTANHVFLPGHRVMVQIQSSWFPLYDRNPQTFVPNIFFAKPADYVKATQRIFHAGSEATNIELPVIEAR